MGASTNQIATRGDLYRMCTKYYNAEDYRAATYMSLVDNSSDFNVTNWTAATTISSSEYIGSSTINSGNAYTCPVEGTYMYVSGTTTYSAITLQPYETVKVNVTVINNKFSTSSSTAYNLYSANYATDMTFGVSVTSSTTSTDYLMMTVIRNSYMTTSVPGSGTFTTSFTYTNDTPSTVTRYIRIKVTTRNAMYNMKTSSSGSVITSGTLYYGWKFTIKVQRELGRAVRYSNIYPQTSRKSSLRLSDWLSTLSGHSLYALYGSYNYSSRSVRVTASLRSLSSSTNLATVTKSLYYNSSSSVTVGTTVTHSSFGTSKALMYFEIVLPATYISYGSINGAPDDVTNTFDIVITSTHADQYATSYVAGSGTISTTRTLTPSSSSSYDCYTSSKTITGSIEITPTKREDSEYMIEITPSYTWGGA